MRDIAEREERLKDREEEMLLMATNARQKADLLQRQLSEERQRRAEIEERLHDSQFNSTVETVINRDSEPQGLPQTPRIKNVVTIHEASRNTNACRNLGGFEIPQPVPIQPIDPVPINQNPNTGITMSVYIKEALFNVPRFDGTNLTAFLRACRRAVSSVPPNLEPHLVALFKNKFSDHTYTAVESIHFENMRDLSDRLKQIFAPTETLNHLRGKLDAAKRYQKETMLTYVNRILDLRDAMLDRKRYNRGEELSRQEIEEIEDEVMEGFLDGLDPELRLRMRDTQGRPLSMIIDEAIAVEKQMERDVAKHGSQTGQFLQNQRNDHEPRNGRDRYAPNNYRGYNDRSNHNNRFARPEQERNFHRNYNGSDRRGQYRDNGGPREDHTRDNSHEGQHNGNREPNNRQGRAADSAPPNQNISNNGFGRDTIPTCNYCKRRGHRIEECYSRRWQNERRQRESQGNGRAGQATGAPGPSNVTPRPVNTLIVNDVSTS